ncbi:membrane-bound lytic murein transglycosylase MltF [Porticoccaceae bacterium LTM1]|nr:membrane-bound lytic murein transglycosylase MltF [Porticoccaceae bacterium LTM1]
MPTALRRQQQQRRRASLKRAVHILVILPPLIFASSLLKSSQPMSRLEIIKERGALRMITTAGPITYYENAKGYTGFEYLLAKGFAEELGVELDVTLRDTLNGVNISLGGPNGDFAAAGLTVTPRRQQIARFSQPFVTTSQTLLYQLGTGRPRSLDELNPDGRLLVIDHSAHSERMMELKESNPSLNWEPYPAADMLELMEMVHSGSAEYSVVDSLAYLVNRGIYPKARPAFDISGEQPVAWAFPRNGDTSLLDAANDYLERMENSGELERLKRQFFDHVDEFSVAGSQLFMSRVETRLPKYEPMFREVADTFNMDWHLLAAIAYQESHWNARAKSPTGVRGLMMLTLPTADEMGITDRLNPEQSLWAGAQYFLKTRDRIPERISEPDRTWLALAAYNIGFGHLEDARVLTEREGKDPDLWNDVQEHLPLLEQKKYYSTLKYRFARGREAASYVQNIRHYRDILQWRTLELDRQKKQQEAFDQDPLEWIAPLSL